MKTVLIIAPQFSPSSYPPAQRVRLFSKHLRGFGWDPIVLTVEPRYLEEEPDWDFAKLISEDLEVIRTKALPFQWTRRVGIGDLGIRSFFHQFQAAKKICTQRKIDLLFISGPPWVVFLIGPMIKRRFGIPYVLDYIDPWISPVGLAARFWKKLYWYTKVAQFLEPAAVRSASHIVAVSEGTNRHLQKLYPFLDPGRSSAIPYGAEPSDFDAVRKKSVPNRIFKKPNGFFNVLYLGAVLPTSEPIMRTFFEAVKTIENESPSLYKRLRIYFVGSTYAKNPREGLVSILAKTVGLESIFSEYPKRIPYLEATQILSDADLLLAVGSSLPYYTASKIFPCILARKPLLAIYHESSSVVEVMRETGAGEAVTFDAEHSVETRKNQIKECLIRMMDPGYRKPVTDWSRFEPYTAQNMTKKLAEVFDCIS